MWLHYWYYTMLLLLPLARLTPQKLYFHNILYRAKFVQSLGLIPFVKDSWCYILALILYLWVFPVRLVVANSCPCQYGLKGASITHYLFKLLKFTHEYLDLKNPHAVVVALVDQSKAFNRVSHQLVIEDLYNMHVPIWLLLILISYLTERSMVLNYKGAS